MSSSVVMDLEVTGLTVQFGGLVAVDGVDLKAQPGAITGLIGPNGAGKTTTFNACTGQIRQASGTVRLGPHVLDGKTPSRRAQSGLGRTFQRMALFDSMTVADNVAMGIECRRAGRRFYGQLVAGRRERAAIVNAAADAMERAGIGALASRPAGDLSTGQRRLVELARAMTARFDMLLLDEPSSGLDEVETHRFGEVLVDLVARDGTGIVLVEHDIELVRRVCTHLHVLDFGRLVLEGPTDEVLESDVVQAAYLGSLEVP